MLLNMSLNKILDKQLFRNYNELYNLILCCYKDISILKAYEELQKKKNDMYNMALHVSDHFIVLVQKDLALTLYKIYYDTNPNANTVPRFRNDINKLLRDNNCECKQVKQKKIKINKNVENTLKVLRRQFLAHVDMYRNGSKIDIHELNVLLDVICKDFNQVCDVIDDDNFFSISDINISHQDMNYYPELLLLYEQK